MAEQLGLFAARRSAITDCPRFPGKLCRDARERPEGCPGAQVCEEWKGPRSVQPAAPTQRPSLFPAAPLPPAEVEEHDEEQGEVVGDLGFAVPGGGQPPSSGADGARGDVEGAPEPAVPGGADGRVSEPADPDGSAGDAGRAQGVAAEYAPAPAAGDHAADPDVGLAAAPPEPIASAEVVPEPSPDSLHPWLCPACKGRGFAGELPRVGAPPRPAPRECQACGGTGYRPEFGNVPAAETMGPPAELPAPALEQAPTDDQPPATDPPPPAPADDPPPGGKWSCRRPDGRCKVFGEPCLGWTACQERQQAALAKPPPPPVCQACGAGNVVLYAAGVPPLELAGPHCKACADQIINRWRRAA